MDGLRQTPGGHDEQRTEVIHRSADIEDHVYEWYGWASPIGLGMFLIALGVVAVLVRVAIIGIK